ncbi:hypothetical protein K438DRAFT_1851197 [Mycena galopus ATCC 62051]|nr:hypothetical protein K438DRAFT_1851197 [Mycena galopus ATCC 62051]
MIVQTMCQFKPKVLLPRLTVPYVQSREIHPTFKGFFMVPSWFTSTLHVLQNSLQKVVTEQVIERPQIWVFNMIQFQSLAGKIFVAFVQRRE